LNRKYLHTSLLFLILLFFGCSTEKNTRVSRAYHNVTSYYNIYFNGKEALKKGQENIEENIKDDYNRMLLIFKETDPKAAELVKSDMETTILKASKLIKLHSITKKPKRQKYRTRKYREFASQDEFNKWVDDSYLLLGKAYFYERNFLSAIENFSYVIRKFPAEPSKYDSEIWLIRAYTELERYTEAAEMIKEIQADDGFPHRLERSLALVTSDLYVRQKDYNEAIKYLDIAIKKTFWSSKKARLEYILAQLFQASGNQDMASAAFRRVVKLNPPYRMAFNAYINAADVFSGKGDAEKLKKELNRMLRDEKNLEFLDQIYYALGNISYKEGNREKAIEYYKKSVTSSFENNNQRAVSSLTLANLFFEDFRYRDSQAYYDSAMMVIDENYPRYREISDRHKSLTRLVTNLVTVETQDSLQRLARMPENERNALVDKWIETERTKQRQQENLMAQQMRGNSYYMANQYRFGLSRSQESAGWYFYNPQTITYGKMQFQQRWGRRKLEDNWRRINKSVSMDQQEMLAQNPDSANIPKRIDDPLKREYYLQDVPINDSLMQLSHEKLRDALYNAGKIFKSDFSDYKRSSEEFEDLNKRYPDNIYLLSTYFDLYDLYELLGDKQKSQYYKDLIINKFPDSKYARYLINPNFFIEFQAQQDSLNRLYQDAFNYYKAGAYPRVVSLVKLMKDFHPDSVIIPKIEFLNTISTGVQGEMSKFENMLKAYVDSFPKAETIPLAQSILKLIQDSTLTDYQKLLASGYISETIKNQELLPGNDAKKDEFGGRFTYDGDLLHYFVIAYPRDTKVDLNRLKFDIANYNLDHYTKIDFDVETEIVDNRFTLVVVRALENKETGLIYYRSIIKNKNVFTALKGITYVNFIASSTNYRQIISEKSYSDYLKFFVANYSRMIGPDFSEEEIAESPEELMNKARLENEILKEKGRFVTVNTVPAGAYAVKIDTAQNFVLAVKDRNLSLRTALSQFAAFNRAEFKMWNLTVEVKNAGDYQLMVVGGIPTLNESMSYFRKVITSRNLFESLGQSVYRNFLITNENLSRIMISGKIDEYMEFFRSSYINRSNPTGPASTPQPASKTDSEGNTQKAQDQAATGKTAYTGPYNTKIEGDHFFVLVVQADGFDKQQLITGIEKFNSSFSGASGLKTEERSLDDSRALILISGLKDKNVALQYFRQIINDRTVYTPLGNTAYRNFLITTGNFNVFLKDKNITSYMDFYRQFYLNQ
jgi:tetratricopeptide (TPR) repeat protein